ncbi:glycine oxidase ThiO [Leptolyngbya sp. NK1-12]|uniref:Thiazole synthase n=1 Tax=Leptolyngbya sp. NK1-12 TaxID=2547451 RepID=A0AA96WPJ8_9CYAN|nr:glycine oxidase ThiO [Leptolyngbya sp. NK1-12]WNZ26156.1 glycine oxidase ThiO [Leptolyngbya sp. NK1-12]
MNPTCDVLIIGGGVIGLSIAIELKLRGARVTVLSRDVQQAASHAAAGMLAPGAERIPASPMLELCQRSQTLYPDWISKLEDLSHSVTHYWACGILAPVFATGDAAGDAAAKPDSTALWLDQAAIQLAQPGLSPEIVGGWWFPEEGQVDNRALAHTLQQAAQILGVQIEAGVTVTAIQQQGGRVVSLKSTSGDWQAEHYILATGAWSESLLPIPVRPRKGQMLAVQVPGALQSPPDLQLHRILYGEEIYIVPRQDGRIVIGATVEEVGFAPNNTIGGVQSLLNAALRLYPPLRDLPIQECWWGFRPATPDELPILGTSHCPNLTLATGHYRNGILLAPITARLIAELVWNQQPDPLLSAFSWQRFQRPSQPAPFLPHSPTPTQPMLQYPSPISPRSATLTSPISPISLTSPTHLPDDPNPLTIAGRPFRSRLMTGTGKYRNFDQMRQSVAASGCEIVTVAVRRVQTNAPGHEGLAEALDWSKIWMLPNTAGCKTAEEAVRVARLGREMAKLLGQEDNNFVKLEVIPDAKYLLPDPIGTLEAAEQLVKEGFAVLPYINADPLLAKRLEEAGCATVMPLGSPIGSGQGIRNAANIQIIIENAQIPVVVDAGIGTPSEAALAMEMGADALLINTAIAQAQNPAMMAQAMGLATLAGRMAYLAGRIPIKDYASASSPLTGTITS